MLGGVVGEEFGVATPANDRAEHGLGALGRQPDGEFFEDEVFIESVTGLFFEKIEDVAEKAKESKLLTDKVFAGVDIAIEQRPTKFGQRDDIAGCFREVEHFRCFRQFEKLSKFFPELYGKGEHIGAASLIANDIEQPNHFADRDVGQRLDPNGTHNRRSNGCLGVGQKRVGQNGVDAVHLRKKRGSVWVAWVGQWIIEDGTDLAGLRSHDDDATSDKDCFMNVVCDKENAVGIGGAVLPEIHDFGAEILGGQHIERAER